MKAKFFLVALAAVILLSFTVLSQSNSKQKTAKQTTEAVHETSTTPGGFAMEDRNQWN